LLAPGFLAAAPLLVGFHEVLARSFGVFGKIPVEVEPFFVDDRTDAALLEVILRLRE
jgi:hypothetical protein